MNFNPIIVVAGGPNSIFLEIFFKAIKYKKYKNPVILIASKKIVLSQMKKLNTKIAINTLNYKNLIKEEMSISKINLINVNYSQQQTFKKISYKSNNYIKRCFKIAFSIINDGISTKLINGPISKKNFLKKSFPGITEFIADKFNSKPIAMLIYNKELSVCPITTHQPIKSISNSINKEKILKKIILINDFYKTYFGFKPKIAITGLNPHCESIDNYNEDEKIILPVVKKLKKKYFVSGPFPADTIFLKNNRKKFNVVVGMYHDQVLTPMKTLYEYDAINITLGLPFLRISPDHGPNEKMMGKNKSNPTSLIKAINFLDKN